MISRVSVFGLERMTAKFLTFNYIGFFIETVLFNFFFGLSLIHGFNEMSVFVSEIKKVRLQDDVLVLEI